jgi:hypothetical protein
MTAIVVKQFGGVSPRTPARFLQDTQAQQALNCPAWLGSLQGLPGTTKLRNTNKTNVKSVYRFGQDETSESNYWFEFTTDTDVVRGPIAGDVEERTFFADGVKPKKTNNVLALTGGVAYPINAYDLGVPRPTVTALPVVSGELTGIPEDRIYTYTFVTGWGEESQPADASNIATAGYGQTVALSGMQVPPVGNHNITNKRIYRSVTGTSSVEYLFVAEIPAAQTTYTDTVEAEALGEVMPSMEWATPPDALKGLVGFPGGIMAGFVGRDVYFSEPYRPFAWPAGYINTVDYPVVGLGVMDTTLAVLTTGVPYFIQGTDPASMAVVKSDIHQACVSKRSIVSMNGMVLYASPDGLVRLSSGGSGLITEMMFSRDQWQTINPETIHAYHWESKYVAFYDGGGFVFDPRDNAFIWHDISASAGFNDMQRDQLYLVINNEMHRWYAGTPKAYTWRSKKWTLPQPMAFSCAQVEAEAYPVTFKFYADGALRHTQTVTNRNAFRLPSGFQARDIEFEVSGTPEVFMVGIAQSPKELAGA